jgi:hypothetical protein
MLDSGAPAETTSVPAPAPPAFLVPEDEGTYALAVGAQTALRLDRQRSWSKPELEGDAVELIRVAFESDPGYTEYDILGRQPGESTVRVTADGTAFVFTFAVVE